MIGVMASAVFPGRIGEPTRVVVLTRRLDGPTRRLLPVVAGTVFSQTLINLLALAILAGGHVHERAAAARTRRPASRPRSRSRWRSCALVLAGPRLLALGRSARARARVARAARASARAARTSPGTGCVVFARPRYGVAAVACQLLAWTLQWLACYMVVLALGLQSQADLATAAAVLLAVNVSAILPATPSNVGVFQAACLVVLAAYGVGAGPGPRLRDHPAGGRGPDGARARHPGAARRGPDLAGHPRRLAAERDRRDAPAEPRA